MGFFDKFFSSRTEPKSYDKHGDVLKKVMTTKDQRSEAIEALAKLAPELSIPQLLKRFEMVLESGLIDTREKEQCMKIIVTHGEKAQEYIREAIKTKKRLAWPIKIAEKIFSQEAYVALLLENLNLNMEVFDEDILERNSEILLALREIHDERIVQVAQEFLSCRDENVRMAALECLENQASAIEKAKEIILNLIKMPVTDDNSRFIGVVNEITKKHNWI
ncbi:MAG: hypothetical protein V4591_09395 [Bdellovibrionota bacterium]